MDIRQAGQNPSRIRSSRLTRCARGFTTSLFLWLAACGGSGGGGSSSPTASPGTTASPPSTDVSDSTAPTISILQPTTGAAYTAPSANLVLSGAAGDDVGLDKMSWANSLGGSGEQTFSGISANWSFNVALRSGTNILTVTAHDTSGNVRDAVLAVSYATQTGQAGLTGYADSSLISRNGSNAVYIYTGTVTPDDLGGAGAVPYTIARVDQETGNCLWGYQSGPLPPGQYTLAFTDQAGNDNPSADDAIVFTGTANVTVQDGTATIHSFRPARVLKVGAGQSYATPSAAADVARDGDVIEIDAGQYLDDIVVWRQDNLTLRGVGGKAHLRATQTILYTPGNDRENGKSIWVIAGNNVLVENIEFSGAAVEDQNGAGIRHDGNGLTICSCYFHDNENGILGGGGDVLIEYSEFAFNGYGDGYTHNMYIDGADRFTLRYSYSHHARIGHNVKSRAPENHILYNRIMDERDGTASYAVDLPNCGVSYLVGNLIQHGPDADNSTVVSYGAEGCLNPRQELYVVNNTLVSDLDSGTFLYVQSGTTARIMNNIFAGDSEVLIGPGTLTTNLVSNAPGLVDMTNFDYRLTAASPARDAGSSAGAVNGVDLTPVYHYVHRSSRESRPVSGTIDIGAYEYSP